MSCLLALIHNVNCSKKNKTKKPQAFNPTLSKEEQKELKPRSRGTIDEVLAQLN